MHRTEKKISGIFQFPGRIELQVSFMPNPMTMTGKERMIHRMKMIIEPLLQDAFRSTSGRYLQEKLEAFSRKEVFHNEDMAEHFAHIYLKEIASQNVVQGFIIERIQFIEAVLGKETIENETFIDIGDPDGIFIKAMNKTGFSANISEIGVKNIHKKGIESIRCDAEHLPFKDASIDNVLFFEIFEHLPNPIEGLKELHRVSGRSVILSIPWVSKTTIHRYNYSPDWPIFEHHIFELDDKDFRKIASHARFSVKHHRIAEVLVPATVKEKLAYLIWDLIHIVRKDPEYQSIHCDLYLGCFKKFSIYHLTKNP